MYVYVCMWLIGLGRGQGWGALAAQERRSRQAGGQAPHAPHRRSNERPTSRTTNLECQQPNAQTHTNNKTTR